MKTPTGGDTLLSQLLYRFRTVSEMKTTSPRGACLLTHNLWEIASFCVYISITEYCKKKCQRRWLTCGDMSQMTCLDKTDTRGGVGRHIGRGRFEGRSLRR